MRIPLKPLISQQYVYWKTLRNLKQLSKSPVSFPIRSDEVKNVLVLLPTDDEYLDAAFNLVRKLREYFKKWHFMVLNVNKIPEEKLDRFDLPNHRFISDLRQNRFQLVLDLNFYMDIRLNYLVGMLKIPYRLHLQFTESDYYNIYSHTNLNNFKDLNHVFDHLKNSFS